tara:strand:- start:216 stop:1154 length:939 start_codon:yes stop_codon:yes gene_type:complete
MTDFLKKVYHKVRWYVTGKYNQPFTLNDGQKKMSYFGKPILSQEQGADAIFHTLKTGAPTMISRFGATELNYLYYYLINRGKTWTDYHRREITHQSGFFPTENESLNRFCKLYLDTVKSVDVLGVWFKPGEDYLVKKYMSKARLVPLRSLEPYYNPGSPWSRALEGKKVLVVHPFDQTIGSQFQKRQLLFKGSEVLPDFKLITYKAVQSLNGSTQYASWFEALEEMKSGIKNIEFDVAIIGAGAYGMPLASFVKSLGKQAVHMGGATQILFGIKGNRWDDKEFFQNMYNEHWTRPSETERPKGPLLEGACYW